MGVVENVERISEFTLKRFGSLAMPKKETHNTFDVMWESHDTEKPVKCGSLELTQMGVNKTEIKFSENFEERKIHFNTGLERFFYLLMQQFVQNGMKTFNK